MEKYEMLTILYINDVKFVLFLAYQRTSRWL